MIRRNTFYNFVKSHPLSLQGHWGEHSVMKNFSWAKSDWVLVEIAVYDHFGRETSLPKDRSPTWKHFFACSFIPTPLFYPSIHPSIPHTTNIFCVFRLMSTMLWASFWRSIGTFFLLSWACSGIFICMLLPLTLQDSETSLTRVWKIPLLSWLKSIALPLDVHMSWGKLCKAVFSQLHTISSSLSVVKESYWLRLICVAALSALWHQRSPSGSGVKHSLPPHQFRLN